MDSRNLRFSFHLRIFLSCTSYLHKYSTAIYVPEKYLLYRPYGILYNDCRRLVEDIIVKPIQPIRRMKQTGAMYCTLLVVFLLKENLYVTPVIPESNT